MRAQTVKAMQDTLGFTRRSAGIDQQGPLLKFKSRHLVAQFVSFCQHLQPLGIDHKRCLTVFFNIFYTTFREGGTHRHDGMTSHPDAHLCSNILHRGRQQNGDKGVFRQIEACQSSRYPACQFAQLTIGGYSPAVINDGRQICVTLKSVP